VLPRLMRILGAVEEILARPPRALEMLAKMQISCPSAGAAQRTAQINSRRAHRAQCHKAASSAIARAASRCFLKRLLCPTADDLWLTTMVDLS